jgi:hypothetical protein
MSNDSNSSFSGAAAPNVNPQPEPDVESSSIVRTIGADRVEHSGITRVTANDLMPKRAGILGTARNHAFGGPAVALNDDTVVEHQGMKLTLKTAATLGLVHRDTQGNYTEAQGSALGDAGASGGPNTKSGNEQDKIDNPEGLDAFHASAEKAVGAFAGNFAPEVQSAVVEQIINGGVDNVDLKNATMGNMSAEKFLDGVGITMHLFQKQADEFVSKSGAVPADFYEWAASQHLPELQEAMRQHAYGRKVGVYGPLLDRFFLDTAPSDDAIRRAGFQTTRDAKGNTLVNVGGLWVTPTVAAKMGAL